MTKESQNNRGCKLNWNGKAVLGPDGKPVMTREYTYTKSDGTRAVVQDQSAGHP